MPVFLRIRFTPMRFITFAIVVMLLHRAINGPSTYDPDTHLITIAPDRLLPVATYHSLGGPVTPIATETRTAATAITIAIPESMVPQYVCDPANTTV